MNEMITKQNNIRLDKNFAFHIDVFKKYKEDEELIKSLILYFSFNFQKNLFGFSTLDPAHFCKVMRHGEENVKRKHPNPIFHEVSGRSKEESERLQKEFGRVSKYRILDSRLENALLILKYEKTLDTYMTKDEFADIISLKDFRYIEELDVIIKKTGKTEKLNYQYKLNEKFEFNLKKFFFNAQINHYNTLRESNLGDWYLKILSRITSESKKGNSKIYYNIEELAKVMKISTNTLHKKGGFSQLKKQINNKFKNKFLPIVGEDIKDLELKWIKGEESRYQNIPVIHWRRNNDELNKKVDQMIYNDLFYTEFFKDVSLYYFNNYDKFSKYDDKLNSAFLDWLLDGSDYEIKIGYYVANYADILGKHDDIQKLAIGFLDKLGQLGKVNAIYKILYFENGKYVFHNKTRNNTYLRYTEIKDFLNELIDNFKFFEEHYSKEMR